MPGKHVLNTHNFSPGVQTKVTVIGCGGTGSALVSGLPYLHQALRAKGHRGLKVTLIDGDLISETNCVRQPFTRAEIGLYKSMVLASRLNLFWNLDWDFIAGYVDEKSDHLKGDIVISCVDRRSARKAIHDQVSDASNQVRYWLDLGNSAAAGQFILGQPLNMVNPRKANRLPTVGELFPEILDPAEEEDDQPSCSTFEALQKQQPFVNQVLANQALALLSRLLWIGEISYHGGFVNLETGQTTPMPIAPTYWKKVRRINRNKNNAQR